MVSGELVHVPLEQNQCMAGIYSSKQSVSSCMMMWGVICVDVNLLVTVSD